MDEGHINLRALRLTVRLCLGDQHAKCTAFWEFTGLSARARYLAQCAVPVCRWSWCYHATERQCSCALPGGLRQLHSNNHTADPACKLGSCSSCSCCGETEQLFVGSSIVLLPLLCGSMCKEAGRCPPTSCVPRLRTLGTLHLIAHLHDFRGCVQARRRHRSCRLTTPGPFSGAHRTASRLPAVPAAAGALKCTERNVHWPLLHVSDLQQDPPCPRRLER